MLMFGTVLLPVRQRLWYVVVVEGGWNGCLLVLVSSLMWVSAVLAGWPKVQPFKMKRRHYIQDYIPT